VFGLCLVIVAGLGLAGCQSGDAPANGEPDWPVGTRVTEHRAGDDLVSAGLGLDGLTREAPAPDDPAAPTPDELRRIAIHGAWNGLAALNPAGGRGAIFDDVPVVAGREMAAFRTLPGRSHPARVLVQLPDAFDADRPCVVAAPASGSRGVYGAIPLVGPRALPAGCAVVYTDKGAGTDFFDHADGSGVSLAGLRRPRGEARLGFEPEADPAAADAGLLAMPHAHSGDHPEADWGAYVLDAIAFAFEVLEAAYDRPFPSAETRVVVAGLSNGAGAALRAAEQDDNGLIDAVVAVMPNVSPPGVPHLYDYATLAALYQPCTLADLDRTMALPLGNPLLAAAGRQRCASLAGEGMLAAPDPALARQALQAAGFADEALELTAVNVALDLWRTVALNYASAYLRRGAADMPCGFSLHGRDATPAQRQSWWASHSGIGASSGIELNDALADGRDPTLPGLLCLRDLIEGDGEDAATLRAAVDQTRATAQLPDIPVVIVHGRHDGLVPAAFSSRPYVERARGNGARLAYWEVVNAQHFDVLLAAPAVAERLVPILPYGWHGLEHVTAVLEGRQALSDDRVFESVPAPAGQPLEWSNLRLEPR
jgi:hydroxybutyrate-dimer hydrolase